MLKGNKGEWSEMYILLKLLGDTVLYPGNEHIERIPNILYPIIKILRSESDRNFEYSIEDNIVIVSGNEEVLRLPVSEFKAKSIDLLKYIKKSSHTTFAIPEIEAFMQKIKCTSIKASSSVKTDITIVIHDEKTNQTPTLGFSIKSQLGSPSTLLNASKTTNFTFRISNLQLDSQEIKAINNIDTDSKIKDRIEAIHSRGGTFQFVAIDKQIFSNNLILMDSLLPQIISQIVFKYFSTENTKIVDLLSVIEQQNPLNFDTTNNHPFYTYKIKRFLTDTALGMVPSKVWTGQYDATGGYLIVKKDGAILCYHIYNRNDFENYLINNTKLETASSSRHKFGKIYEEDSELFFKLNLQIRFTK